jgi:hypothetical protein
MTDVLLAEADTDAVAKREPARQDSSSAASRTRLVSCCSNPASPVSCRPAERACSTTRATSSASTPSTLARGHAAF